MADTFRASPVFTNAELQRASAPRTARSAQLVALARQNLRLLGYDIDSARVLCARRRVLSNYVSSRAALVEDRALMLALEREFGRRRDAISRRGARELREVGATLRAQEQEHAAALRAAERRAERAEARTAEMRALEMRYFAERAEYELYQESSRARAEYESECRTLRALQEEQKSTNVIKAKLDGLRAKQRSSGAARAAPGPSIPSPRIAFQICQNKKKTKK